MRLAFVPDFIEEPNYSDMSYETKLKSTYEKLIFERLSNSQTQNPFLSALHLQHVHVRDEWAVICRDVVGGNVETKHHRIALDYDTSPHRLPRHSQRAVPRLLPHEGESTRYYCLSQRSSAARFLQERIPESLFFK